MKRIKIEGIIDRVGSGEIPMAPTDAVFYTFEQLEKELTAAAGEPVEVEINTPGGNVDVGVAMHEMMWNYPGELSTLGHETSSIGSVLLLGGKKNRRVVKDAMGMIHQAWIDPLQLEGIQLNADTLQELQTEAEASNAKIMGVYKKVLGEDKERELIQLMQEETVIGAERMLELGFATEIVEAQKRDVRVRALNYSTKFLNIIQNTEGMTTKEISEKLDKLAAAVGTFMNKFSGKFKNQTFTTADGVQIFVPAEDGVVVGKTAFTVENGQPTETPVAPGEYPIDGGKVIVVGEGGMITEEKDAPAPPADSPEMAQLKNELAAAIAENTTLKAAATQKEEEVKAQLSAVETEKQKDKEEMTALMNNMRTEIDTLKKTLTGDPESKDDHIRNLFQNRNERKKPEAPKNMAEAMYQRYGSQN